MIKTIQENKILFSIILLVLLFIGYINLPEHFSDDLYKEYTSKTNKEMQEHLKEIRGIAYSFAQESKLPLTYRETMYDCLGSLIYKENADAAFSKTLQKCKDDYAAHDAKAEYYNEAWLRKEFSHWHGAYIPLERIIQKHIKEPKSYEHLSTSATMHFSDARPHMFVSTDFRAANMDGYMLDRTMEVKVDAKTKELYDLK